jgi:hypothetical protein
MVQSRSAQPLWEMLGMGVFIDFHVRMISTLVSSAHVVLLFIFYFYMAFPFSMMLLVD